MSHPKFGFPKSDVSQEVSLKGTFQADAIEQCGRRDKVRISGVTEESREDVYQEVVVVAQKADVAVSKEDIGLCHRLPTRKPGSKTVVAKLVRCQTKHNMRAEKKL